MVRKGWPIEVVWRISQKGTTTHNILSLYGQVILRQEGKLSWLAGSVHCQGGSGSKWIVPTLAGEKNDAQLKVAFILPLEFNLYIYPTEDGKMILTSKTRISLGLKLTFL